MDLLPIERLIATTRYYFSLPMPGESRLERPARKPRNDKRMRRRRAQSTHNLNAGRLLSP